VAVPSSAVSHGIIGTSKPTSEIHEQIQIAATNDANVVIEGESGTGKELVARAIHAQSARAKAPFVPVDCGALPEALIEAELFGAKRGSYTGSLSDRVGLFEAAHTGTIFLDEISNLGLAAQAKLLRVLQDREVRKIGSTSGKFVDVRLIVATNCNLEKLVQQGKFRNDLLYRLKVLYLLIPPLRERRGDIPVLATTFLERLNTANQTQKYFGSSVMPKLTAGNYPGNVRELQNAVERAFYSTRGAVITQVSFLESSGSPASYDAENWFRDLTEGRQDFWRAVHDPYKRRDIPRERVVALVDYGLRTTRGNYKAMASKLQIRKDEYRRFMDFLRRNKCLLDFRPYRRMAEPSE
jgi:Nif-specific regulatory protein